MIRRRFPVESRSIAFATPPNRLRFLRKLETRRRGLRIASRAQDAFGAFLALGITTMIAVQALVNMSVVLGLLPTKGIPLPLVSAGGSSLLINLLGMGILLNISQHEAQE